MVFLWVPAFFVFGPLGRFFVKKKRTCFCRLRCRYFAVSGRPGEYASLVRRWSVEGYAGEGDLFLCRAVLHALSFDRWGSRELQHHSIIACYGFGRLGARLCGGDPLVVCCVLCVCSVWSVWSMCCVCSVPCVICVLCVQYVVSFPLGADCVSKYGCVLQQ